MSDIYDDLYEEPMMFAGAGDSYAGPMGELTGRYIQARLQGINRATTDSRVNQRRAMKSPEFAMAKALGISTQYNSGGSQIDPGRMMQRAQSPSAMERDYAMAKMAEFDKRTGVYPASVPMAAVGLVSKGSAIPEPMVQLPPEISAPAPQEKREPKKSYKEAPKGGSEAGPSARGAESSDEEERKKKKKLT